MSFFWRMVLSIPLFYFIWKGHTWAIVLTLFLQMLAIEAMALISKRLIERNKQLLDLVKQLNEKIEKSGRVDKVLADVFDRDK